MDPSCARRILKVNTSFILAGTCILATFMQAQVSSSSKWKLSQSTSERTVLTSTAAHGAASGGVKPPPAASNTWTGGGSNSDWSNASNWNNGAITTGENLLISLSTAATTDDANFTIGTLTLSNAGDSVK
jgi:hypothetical protein